MRDPKTFLRLALPHAADIGASQSYICLFALTLAAAINEMRNKKCEYENEINQERVKKKWENKM